MRAAENGKDEIVGLLLEAGVPWNAVDRRGRCAGDFALSAGHEAATMLLVDAGTVPLMQYVIETAHVQRASAWTHSSNA